jgi:hypothetical protein
MTNLITVRLDAAARAAWDRIPPRLRSQVVRELLLLSDEAGGPDVLRAGWRSLSDDEHATVREAVERQRP